jgi:hypothetical protein
VLLYDIRKIQKINKELEKGNIKEDKAKKKIEKLKSKYMELVVEDGVIEKFYVDKLGNKVAIMNDGEVVQFDGSVMSHRFVSFFLAYIGLLLINLVIFMISLGTSKFDSWLTAFGYTISPLAIVLNVLTAYYCRDVVFKNKMFLLLLIGTFILNLVSFIFDLFTIF